MRAAFAWSVLVLTAVVIGGCATSSRLPASPAEQVVVDAAEHVGGVDWPRKISRISGTALVELYEPDGSVVIRGQQFTAYPRWGLIQANGRLPGGAWHAWVTIGGLGLVTTGGDFHLRGGEKDQIEQYLRLILHRLRGPVNLLGGGEQPVDVQAVFVAGMPMHRVGATGRPELASAYFFDRKYRQLRLILKEDAGGAGAGTVTILTHKRVDNVLLPVAMEVVEAGSDSLIGERARLSVRLENLRVH